MAGIFCSAIGLILFGISVWARGEPTQPKGLRRMLSLGIIGGFLLFLGGLTWSFGSAYQSSVPEIMHPDAEQLKAIVIGPVDAERTGAWSSLVKREIRITDRRVIEKVAGLLATSKKFSPDHPHAKWTCTLGLEYANHVAQCRVVWDEGHGYMVINILSHGSGGWNLGYWRQDDLRGVLEDLASSR